ncbi:hypothetical protein WQ54_19635 [Bacillus sp. SA1-12]|uniref:hypothetical protein n=1 Tax=Bacillus sp. SA1-12 TaxID=1455638 RepID=UPI000626F526|nr:hypothetical protein [Bacillus sp. SA1-12]KKI90203.1 hypothetical protein WQ54_19635 [Bacillus sp. SA1-12]
MVNENFNQFIKTEAKHKSEYLGSDQKNAHEKNTDISSSINSRANTDMSVGAIGRDVFENRNKKE